MLVMRRREGEAILIGDDVEVRILSIIGSRVKIGITAPRLVPVTAREVALVRTENQAAAQARSGAAADVMRLLQGYAPGEPAKTAETRPLTADTKEDHPEA